MSEANDAARNRVVNSAAEFLTKHPEWTVREALVAALQLETVLYGVPGAPMPRGIVGSPLITAALKSNRGD